MSFLARDMLWVFANRVLRKVFGAEMKELTEDKYDCIMKNFTVAFTRYY